MVIGVVEIIRLCQKRNGMGILTIYLRVLTIYLRVLTIYLRVLTISLRVLTISFRVLTMCRVAGKKVGGGNQAGK